MALAVKNEFEPFSSHLLPRSPYFSAPRHATPPTPSPASVPDLTDLPALLTGLSADTRDRLLSTLLLLIVLIGLRVLSERLMRLRALEINTRYRWRKGVNYFLLVAGLLSIGRIWSSGIAQFSTFLGLLGAGLAIALRDPITNMAGWLFLIWRRPFRVGDRIQIEGVAGDVVDVRLFQFTLLEIRGRFSADQPTGRLVHFPNALVFTTPQFNATDGFPYVWAELPVMVTFESDWKKAKRRFQEIAQEHGKKPKGLRHSLHARYAIGQLQGEPVVYTSVANDGVVLTIRVLSDLSNIRTTEENIWEDVLSAVAEWDDVDFAYPTTRFYDNRREGKPAARAPLTPLELGTTAEQPPEPPNS